MNPLNKQLFYRGFRKQLIQAYGAEQADEIWEEAGKEYKNILQADPQLKHHKGAMVLPSAALYHVLQNRGADAPALLNEYGETMGKQFAGIVHKLTSLPGADRVLWKNVSRIMQYMSSEKLGYSRRLVSEPPGMYGVDILSCPYHELARLVGTEEAVCCICHMDKEYSKGFHHMHYDRLSALPEGASCCQYRLRFDPEKD